MNDFCNNECELLVDVGIIPGKQNSRMWTFSRHWDNSRRAKFATSLLDSVLYNIFWCPA